MPTWIPVNAFLGAVVMAQMLVHLFDGETHLKRLALIFSLAPALAVVGIREFHELVDYFSLFLCFTKKK